MAQIKYEPQAIGKDQYLVTIRGCVNHMEAIGAEYFYMEKQFGKQNIDWKIQGQRLINSKQLNGPGVHNVDQFDVLLKDGTALQIGFDITESFGQ